jgi:hypothetical protein
MRMNTRRRAPIGYESAVHDDDDWVGTPPEGRRVSDPERAAFWRAQTQRYMIGAGLLMAIVVALLVVLLAT